MNPLDCFLLASGGALVWQALCSEGRGFPEIANAFAAELEPEGAP
jgi:hypothetical protein